ncbi:MAG: ABC transporter permease, partial [Gammaproteobacteria bacterium]|nr:ABC transporter permease [Gammaproteobacteria bacterium]
MNEPNSTLGQTADAVAPPPPRDKKWTDAWREIKKAPLSAKFGLVVILLYVFVALFAPVLTPFGESEIVGQEYEEWSGEHVLGTDNLGRDMLTR